MSITEAGGTRKGMPLPLDIYFCEYALANAEGDGYLTQNISVGNLSCKRFYYKFVMNLTNVRIIVKLYTDYVFNNVVFNNVISERVPLSIAEFSLYLAPKVCCALIQEASERIATEHGRLYELHLQVQFVVAPMTAQDLTKIATELVDNAFNFPMHPLPVQVSAMIENGRYVIAGADQGRGIAQGNIERIKAFVQFARNQYEQQGAGLGLALVWRLVELARVMLVRVALLI